MNKNLLRGLCAVLQLSFGGLFVSALHCLLAFCKAYFFWILFSFSPIIFDYNIELILLKLKWYTSIRLHFLTICMSILCISCLCQIMFLIGCYFMHAQKAVLHSGFVWFFNVGFFIKLYSLTLEHERSFNCWFVRTFSTFPLHTHLYVYLFFWHEYIM